MRIKWTKSQTKCIKSDEGQNSRMLPSRLPKQSPQYRKPAGLDSSLKSTEINPIKLELNLKTYIIWHCYTDLSTAPAFFQSCATLLIYYLPTLSINQYHICVLHSSICISTNSSNYHLIYADLVKFPNACITLSDRQTM